MPTLILGIENSNPDKGPGGFHGGVALAQRDAEGLRPIAMERLAPASERDDDVMSAIARLFARAGRSPTELGEIAVSVGPGGFTGLRIACVTAKALAEVTGSRCVGVPTTAALRCRFGARGRWVCVLLAWKHETVWCARFDPGGASAGSACVKFGEIFEGLPPGAPAAVIADPRLAGVLRERGVIAEGTVVESPRFDALAVIEAGEGLAPTDPLALVPIYPREPEAVTKWRVLHPEGRGDGGTER